MAVVQRCRACGTTEDREVGMPGCGSRFDLRLGSAVLLLVLLSTTTLTTAAEPPSALGSTSQVSVQADDLRALRDDVAAVKNTVTEVRRDELNYQLERDILKEAYASNLNAVNATITVALGTITIVGVLLAYFGLRNVRQLRDDFTRELTDFRSARSELERRLAEIINQTNEAKERINALATENRDRDLRLKYLELTEKIGALLQQQRFAEAVRYIEVARGMQPNDEGLLLWKAAAHLKLRQFEDAASTYQTILALPPPLPEGSIQAAVENLAELTTFIRPRAEFDRYSLQYAERLSRRPGLLDYLRAAREAVDNDETALLQLMGNIARQVTPDAKLLGTWDFMEARHFCSLMKSPRTGVLLQDLISLLESKITPDDLRAKLSALSTPDAAGGAA